MVRDGRTLGHKTLDEIQPLQAVQNDPTLVQSFFRAPSVAYIADRLINVGIAHTAALEPSRQCLGPVRGVLADLA